MRYERNVDNYITVRSLELFDQGFSETQIAETISQETEEIISRNVVHGRIYRNKEQAPVSEPVKFMPYFNKYADYYLGGREEEPKVDFTFETGRIRFLVLNDLHVPFQHEDALNVALRENRSADVLVLSELMDLYSQSSFAKDSNVPIERELEEVIRLYELFSATFPVTYVVAATHDFRITNKISSRLGTDLLFLMETNINKYLAKPFPNIIVVDDSYLVLNDILFSHFNKHSSNIPMRGADGVKNWLDNWGDSLKIPRCRAIVHAHTHHSGVVNYPDMQLIETGCLQNHTNWIFGKLPLLPWVHGWAVLETIDGKVDRNKTILRVFEGGH